MTVEGNGRVVEALQNYFVLLGWIPTSSSAPRAKLSAQFCRYGDSRKPSNASLAVGADVPHEEIAID
jgi:hypothetical protein